MTVIIDGAGTGVAVKVTKENKILASATSHTEEHFASLMGDTYIANTTTTANTLTTVTGNTYNLLYIENSSATRLLIVQKIAVSADTAGMVLDVFRNPVLGVVSANNVEIPINDNFSSGKTADGIFHSWDETGTVGIGGLTGGDNIGSNILPGATVVVPIDGSVILGQGNSLTVRATNGTGGNVEVSALVRFYYEDADK